MANDNLKHIYPVETEVKENGDLLTRLLEKIGVKEPLYHGTDKNFREFELTGSNSPHPGGFFSSDPKTSAAYGREIKQFDVRPKNPVDLDAPLTLDDVKKYFPKLSLEQRMGAKTPEELYELNRAYTAPHEPIMESFFGHSRAGGDDSGKVANLLGHDATSHQETRFVPGADYGQGFFEKTQGRTTRAFDKNIITNLEDIPRLRSVLKGALGELGSGALKSIAPAALGYTMYDMATGGDPLGSEPTGSEEEDLAVAEQRGRSMFRDALGKHLKEISAEGKR